MATANIPWDDGSGQNMSVEWDGTENGEIVISSPTNPSLSSSRNKTIQVRTTAGSPQITRTINVVQEAAIYTYEYEIQPSSSAVIAASGGTISYTATLKIYLQGSLLKTESVTPTCRIISGTGFSASSNAVTAANRGTEYSTSQRSAQVAVEFVTAETGETLSETVTVTQAANNRVVVYGKPTITSFEVADIPASGGSVSSGSVEYSQSRHYYYDSGDTEELSPLTSGGQVTFGDPVTAESLGTTVKERTEMGTLTATVTMNEKSGSASATVYQQANVRTAEDISYGIWQVSVVADKYTTSSSPCSAGGGNCTLTVGASRTRTQNYSYTSGATSTSPLSDETGTPTLSASGTGVLLSGTALIWIGRGITTGDVRSATVTATMGTVSATETVYQEANEIVGEYLVDNDGVINLGDYPNFINPTTIEVDSNYNSGHGKYGIGLEFTSGARYQPESYSEVQEKYPDWLADVTANADNVFSFVGDGVVCIDEAAAEVYSPSGVNGRLYAYRDCAVVENEGSEARTGYLQWRWSHISTFTTPKVTVTQAAAAYLNVSPTLLSFEASGGTKTITIDTNESWTIE